MDVSIRHRLGALTLEVEFRLSAPWTVLFAPSGAGKTTILRIISGLTRPDDARIAISQPGSEFSGPQPVLELTDTSRKKHVPVHLRSVPMVTQNSALFPHLTVADNVLYGFNRKSGLRGPIQDHQNRLDPLLAVCRIEHLRDRLPAQLSGGEKQRVALARALGASGSIVLLDEPFAGLDAPLKDELMRDVKEWLATKKLPVLQITHDVGEAFAVADEVIRLHSGRITDQGPAHRVLQHERRAADQMARSLASLKLRLDRFLFQRNSKFVMDRPDDPIAKAGNVSVSRPTPIDQGKRMPR